MQRVKTVESWANLCTGITVKGTSMRHIRQRYSNLANDKVRSMPVWATTRNLCTRGMIIVGGDFLKKTTLDTILT